MLIFISVRLTFKMKKVFLIVLFCSCCFFAAGQNFSITGQTIDSSSTINLQNTSIAILYAKDSILYKFTRSDQNRSFYIDKLSKGNFILLISYPGYVDYVQHFSLDSLHISIDFGVINMELKSQLLREVIIKGELAKIKIKGDTTEYNAAAFKLQANEKVEDLLKRLPGIEVDQNGRITAQGQTVTNVLVDGEEFFGDDPTLVTRNIRADMVDKVQLYDKKSDQAAFTNIDDGKKTKTINIKLKEDKKNGYFGEAEGGLGTDNYHIGQLLYNRFKAQQKISVFGILGNDGTTGLGWENSEKYGSSNEVELGSDGLLNVSGGSGDGLDSFDGTYNGQGNPTAKTSGLHYDDKFNKDKESVNVNFKIGSLTVDGTNGTLSQNNLPTSEPINSTSNESYHNDMLREKLDLTYKVDIDTSSTLKFSINATDKNSKTIDDYKTSSFQGNTILNNNIRNITNNGNSKTFNTSALFTKKFKKKGRTFSWNISEAYNLNQSKGFLNSDISYYNNGIKDSAQNIEQYKTDNFTSSILSSKWTYSEPLSKQLAIVFNYGFILNNGSNNDVSYNQSLPGVYNLLDTAYSNNYSLSQIVNQEGAILNYSNKKILLNFGTNISEVAFKQNNEYTNDVFQRNFLDWFPQANFMYRFSNQSGFRVNYRGNTNQPGLEQIQPIANNTDPLNITIGNSKLTPSFDNNLELQYQFYRAVKQQSLNIDFRLKSTTNAIILNTATDSTGKSVNRYVNLSNGNPENFNASISYGQKIALGNLNIGAELAANSDKNFAFSNGDLNSIKLNTYSISFKASKYLQNKYEFNISFGPNYSYGGSSLQNTNNNGHGFNGDAYFNLYSIDTFQIGTDLNYQYSSATPTFNQSFSRLLLNTHISKVFLKSGNLKVTLKGNDLLNQNAGFNRTVNGNFMTQNTYNTIRRYIMLVVAWDFNKIGAKTN